jgi:histidinol-phosphate aminotransferase
MEDFLARVPAHVVVVLDEAYNEYLAPAEQFDSTAWVRRFPNLFVSRTFSKAYGLAALRVGYGLAQPAVTNLLNRVRQPFNVNALAQAAALAALADTAFLRESFELNQRGKQQLVEGFKALGLEQVPSHGNFILVKVGPAAKVYQELLKRGVIVRPVGGGYGLPEWLRVSIGLPAENAQCLDALRAALAVVRAA